MFQRIGPAAYKADLTNTIALCKSLGNPEHKFRSIHIAGTNGKGSTSHLLAAIFQAAGYKTGLYTSPHLKDFRERIRINGKMIPRLAVTTFVQDHRKKFEKLDLSFFEWTVGLAFDYFATQNVDIAIIETGLGGRLDSTNVVHPELSVITNISYDHMNLLGNTIQKIAGEKAGIIKSGVPVIIGETQEEIKSVFTSVARKLKTNISFADEHVRITTMLPTNDFPPQIKFTVYDHGKLWQKNVRGGLTGSYQRKNYGTVLHAIFTLRELGYALSDNAILSGLRNVVGLTGLRGRWEVLAKSPLVIADTGHNEGGIREIVKQLKHTPNLKLHIVLGVVNDKDPSKVLELLPKKATYYFCKANLPRAMEASELQQHAQNVGLTGAVFPSVKKAVQAAKAAATAQDVVFIGGSTFVVAEAI
jgi:dihydrofolate synthase/folylpolyglutamate synthase